jgi:lipoate-protein ligase A
MTRHWRVADTGLRPAAQNIALDRALLEARKADEISATLRFYRTTSSVLLGLQDSAAQEIHDEYCRANGIAVQRRITGGPSYYTDPVQIGWSLYVQKQELGADDLRSASRQLCHALSAAVSALGTEARVRRHDEVEIDGRTVGGCGVGSDDEAVVFHGWVYVALDLGTLVQALRLPATYAFEQLTAAAGERFTDLATALGHAPQLRQLKANIVEAFESAHDAEFAEGDLTLTEESRYRDALPEIDTTGWVDLAARPLAEAPQLEAVHHSATGVLRAALLVDAHAQNLRRIWFATDNPPNPRRMLLDLEAELHDVPFSGVTRRIERFFGSRPADDALKADDVVTVIARALRRPLIASRSP